MIYLEIKTTTPLAGCDEYLYVAYPDDMPKEKIAEIASDFCYDNAEEAYSYVDDDEDYDYDDFMEECTYFIREITKEEYEENVND